MRIQIATEVGQDFETVFSRFDEELFLALNPPLLPVQLNRFDGCNEGDEIHLILLFGLQWVSLVTEHGKSEVEIYFVDEGQKLPFFLSYWQHRHRVIKKDTQTLIVDDINYRSPFRWLDYLLYPTLYVQFYYRRSVYQRFFQKK